MRGGLLDGWTDRKRDNHVRSKKEVHKAKATIAFLCESVHFSLGIHLVQPDLQ